MASSWRSVKQAPSGELYQSESTTQQSAVRWFNEVYPEFEYLFFSIPNGGKMGGKVNKSGVSIQAAIMVGEGLKSGVADLLFSVARCGLHGLYIEMKTPVGVWSKEQQEFAWKVTQEGYGYVLCYSLADFKTAILTYLSGSYVQKEINRPKAGKEKTVRRNRNYQVSNPRRTDLTLHVHSPRQGSLPVRARQSDV